MFNKIVNPTTGRRVNTNSKLGKTIINQYLYTLNNIRGGAVSNGQPRRSRQLPKVDVNKIPEKLKEIMDFNKCSRKEAEDMAIQDVIDEVYPWDIDPKNQSRSWESMVNEDVGDPGGQTRESIREMLRINNWEILKVTNIFEINLGAKPRRMRQLPKTPLEVAKAETTAIEKELEAAKRAVAETKKKMETTQIALAAYRR